MLAKLSVAFALAAVSLVGATGCSSMKHEGAPAASSEAVPARAVIVTPGNGGSQTVFLATNDPANPTALCAGGSSDVCPECKAAAAKYFLTGVLDPKCSRTGATRTPVTQVPGNFYHQ